MTRFVAFGVAAALSALLLGGSAAAQSTTPSPAASSAAPDADAVMARAQDWLHRLQSGTIDRSQLDPQMNALLTADLVKRLAAEFGPLGKPLSFTPAGEEIAPNTTAYIYRVEFSSKTLDEIFILDGAGLISGLRFTPAQ